MQPIKTPAAYNKVTTRCFSHSSQSFADWLCKNMIFKRSSYGNLYCEARRYCGSDCLLLQNPGILSYLRQPTHLPLCTGRRAGAFHRYRQPFIRCVSCQHQWICLSLYRRYHPKRNSSLPHHFICLFLRFHYGRRVNSSRP